MLSSPFVLLKYLLKKTDTNIWILRLINQFLITEPIIGTSLICTYMYQTPTVATTYVCSYQIKVESKTHITTVTQSMHIYYFGNACITTVTQYMRKHIHHHGDTVYNACYFTNTYVHHHGDTAYACWHTSPWWCSIFTLHTLQTHGNTVSCFINFCTCVTICILMYVRICLHSNMHILRHHGDACICKVPYLMIAKLLFCGFN